MKKEEILCRACGEPNPFRLGDEFCPSCLEDFDAQYDSQQSPNPDMENVVQSECATCGRVITFVIDQPETQKAPSFCIPCWNLYTLEEKLN